MRDSGDKLLDKEITVFLSPIPWSEIHWQCPESAVHKLVCQICSFQLRHRNLPSACWLADAEQPVLILKKYIKSAPEVCPRSERDISVIFTLIIWSSFCQNAIQISSSHNDPVVQYWATHSLQGFGACTKESRGRRGRRIRLPQELTL